MEVLESCKGEDDSDGRKANSRGEDFEVIKSRALVIPFGHQSSLVEINRAICVVLDLKYPL